MNAKELLLEIEQAFENEPHPGDFNIVNNNAPNYDLESLGIREGFKAHTWQTLPDNVLLYEQGSYSFLSKKGYKYYLPSYLSFVVRDYHRADSIPDNLVFSLTLPAEVDVIASALDTVRYRWDESMPKVDCSRIHLLELREINDKVHRFIDRHSQFSPAQGRAIHHFLTHMRDQYGDNYWNREPDTAIERYWFQFA